jgi:hypothetical protein
VAASVSLSPSERSQRARIAAYSMHAQHDPKETTAKAREAFRAQFYEGIPEDLPQAERDRRAEAAFKEHMARLAFLSAKARRKGATDG